MDFYHDLPPVTRLLLTVFVATGFTSYFRLLPLQWIYMDWRFVAKLPPHGPQVWRLLTSYTFIGRPSIAWLFKLVWLLQYGAAFEKARFMHNTADAVTCVGFGMLMGLAMDLLLPWFFHFYFHGTLLIFMFVYLWSKQNPQAPVSFFGVIKMTGLYLPFVFLLLEMVQGGEVYPSLAGILIGHMYYFLTDVYPRASGRTLIYTPQWLARAVHRAGLGQVPLAAVGPRPHPSDARFRAFAGRGHRLAD